MKSILVLAVAACLALGCSKKDAQTTPGSTAPAASPEKKMEQPAATPAGQSGDTTITASGLKFIDLKRGTGATPATGQTCVTHYTIWLAGGEKIQSSRDSQPFEFKLGAGNVIKGWEEGIATMKVGGQRKLFIKPELAWGERGFGNGMIPPNAAVIFDVELLAVK